MKGTYARLIAECSSLDVILSTEGKHKEMFSDNYQKYAHDMHTLEAVLCAFVKTTIDDRVSIKNGLAVIQRLVF